MFVAMNRFRVVPAREGEWERIWKERESHLQGVPGFLEFALPPRRRGGRLHQSQHLA